MSLNKKSKKFLEDLRLKIEKFMRKINFKKSYKYKFLLVVIVLGYVFFFSSGVIFKSNNGVTSTELNKKITLKNSEIIVKDMSFNQETKFLQIKIATQKTNINFDNDYEFEAIEKENLKEKLNVEFLKVDDNNIVIFINTSKKWSAIALDVKEKNLKEVGKERLYIDKESCTINNELDRKIKEEYMIENLEDEIKIVDETISKYKNEIEEKKTTRSNTEEEIKKLESEKEYLTEKEKMEANQKIDSYKSNIDTLKNSIIDIENKILDEKDKNKMLNKKMNDIIKNLPDELYKKYRDLK